MKVVHLVQHPGQLTQRWIDWQVCDSTQGEAVLWSVGEPSGVYTWESVPTAIAPAGRRSWLPGDERAVSPGWLRDQLRSEAVDVVHAHFGPTAFWASRALRDWTGTLVASYYGYDATARRYTSWPWTARYRRLFARTTLVLAEGPCMARRLVALGCRPEAVRVLRLPVRVPPLLTVGQPDCDILMAGRLVEKKGFAVGLRAFAQAFARGEASLRIVGDGPLRQSLIDLAAKLDRGQDVEFLASVPATRFVQTLKSARVCVFPSITARNGDGEGGAPVTVPMAQSLGVPVIVSDHDDLPWIVAEGTPTVSAGDVDELASAMRTVTLASRVGDPALGAWLEHSAGKIRELHDEVPLAEQRWELYRLAAAGRRE